MWRRENKTKCPLCDQPVAFTLVQVNLEEGSGTPAQWEIENAVCLNPRCRLSAPRPHRTVEDWRRPNERRAR